MAKFKLQGGAEIDLFTKDEFREGLADWLAEIKRGVRFLRGSLYGVVDATGALRLGDAPNGVQVGPAGSVVWAITRATVAGLTSGQSVDLYVNDSGSPSKAGTITAAPGYLLFGSTGLILNPLDKLIVTGATLTNGATVFVNVQAVELPVQLAWQLIG